MALETGKVATDLLISGVAKSNEPAMIVPNSTQGRPVREKSKEKEDDMEGLPADVAAVNALQAQYMADGQITIKEEIDLKRKIASLKTRLDTWKKARDVVEKNNASGEYAINDRGFAYVINDKGEVEKKHVNTLNKYDKGRILTYGKLLDLTFNKYAFDDDMLNTVGNAVTASMAQKKLIDVIKDAPNDSASATSGSGSVTSMLKGILTSSEKYHKKWSGVQEKVKDLFKTLVKNMDAKDKYALVLKGRLNYDETEALDNNEEVAVFESLRGWTGSSVEEENTKSFHYTSIGTMSSRKKDGEDDDSGLMTSSKVALDVLSNPDLKSFHFNFGNNGGITIKGADALPTYNSSATASVATFTLEQLLNQRGSMATDKMSFYLNDDIYIGDKKIHPAQYKTIQIESTRMKTAFIPFRSKNGGSDFKPDFELMNVVAKVVDYVGRNNNLPSNTVIQGGNINYIADQLDNYFKKENGGEYSNVRIINTNDPDDKNRVLGKTIADVVESYFRRNYEQDFEGAKIHPCDICYANFSIGGEKTFGGNDGKHTFSEREAKYFKYGLDRLSNYNTGESDEDKARDETWKYQVMNDYNLKINSAYRESNNVPYSEGNPLGEITDLDKIGRGLLILPYKDGDWSRAFNTDYVQLEKSKRTRGMMEADKEDNQAGYEKGIYKDAKGDNQYTPPSVK